MIMPGDNVTITVKLINPIAMEKRSYVLQSVKVVEQ
jgi:translation elongation factor EF-Tu-like GTPase